jgi:hypothetical protein
MADKRTHFGRAGEYFAMSELLLRGWNVAVPVVDLGDDVFVIDDNDKTTWRLQVKTSMVEVVRAESDTVSSRCRAVFTLSRAQLRTAQPIELFYMLMLRFDGRWRFLVVPRADLLAIRERYVDGARERGGPGRLPAGDAEARSDALRLVVELDGDGATGWDASLASYLDAWPDALPVAVGGPGSVGSAPIASVTTAPAARPDPSRDPET